MSAKAKAAAAQVEPYTKRPGRELREGPNHPPLKSEAHPLLMGFISHAWKACPSTQMDATHYTHG